MALVGRWQEAICLLEIIKKASLLHIISFNCALKACGERWDVALALLQQIHQAMPISIENQMTQLPGAVGAQRSEPQHRRPRLRPCEALAPWRCSRVEAFLAPLGQWHWPCCGRADARWCPRCI